MFLHLLRLLSMHVKGGFTKYYRLLTLVCFSPIMYDFSPSTTERALISSHPISAISSWLWRPIPWWWNFFIVWNWSRICTVWNKSVPSKGTWNRFSIKVKWSLWYEINVIALIKHGLKSRCGTSIFHTVFWCTLLLNSYSFIWPECLALLGIAMRGNHTTKLG